MHIIDAILKNGKSQEKGETTQEDAPVCSCGLSLVDAIRESGLPRNVRAADRSCGLMHACRCHKIGDASSVAWTVDWSNVSPVRQAISAIN